MTTPEHSPGDPAPEPLDEETIRRARRDHAIIVVAAFVFLLLPLLLLALYLRG